MGIFTSDQRDWKTSKKEELRIEIKRLEADLANSLIALSQAMTENERLWGIVLHNIMVRSNERSNLMAEQDDELELEFDDHESLCPICDGSGEARHAEGICRYCKGTGYLDLVQLGDVDFADREEDKRND